MIQRMLAIWSLVPLPFINPAYTLGISWFMYFWSQSMFKLLNGCAHFTCYQGNVQNTSSEVSTVCELRTSRYTSWIYKRQRNQRSNCQHLLDHGKSKRVPEKTSISAFLTMPKPLTVWITINYGKFWKMWKYQTIWPASWETCMQVKKQQLELDMEQQTGSK